MLTWVGKRALSQVTAFPPQLVERHDAHHILGLVSPDDPGIVGKRVQVFAQLRDQWNAACWEGQPTFSGVAVPESGGLLLHGDNLECLATLLAVGYRGKVDLIYIDPPFDSGADYVRKVSLRGAKGGAKLQGQSYTLGEQIQYTDIWANDNYLQFMYERLLLLKELLSSDGAIWIHCDWRRSHQLRMLTDEVFAGENFRAHVVWRTMTSSGYKGKSSLGRSHADLLYYSKSNDFTYSPIYKPISEEMLARYHHEDSDGRKFKDSYLGEATAETVDALRKANRLYETSKGTYRIKHYLDEAKGTFVDDFWEDVDVENSQALVQTGYPTQKPEALLARLVQLSSRPGDMVLDCFIGSGTTAAVAQRLGRRWIGCDINKGAIQTTAKRLRRIVSEEISQALADKKEKDAKLPGISETEVSDHAKPCQFGFSVWRVNDYDLQVQHNEAVNIACEHIGVQRTRSDSFFDGTRGKNLVKIIPFDHPLSPVDLEELRRELDARPDETRNITLVCLGIELAARAWVEDWNRLRKGSQAVNRIDVIELRTDPKYGKFLIHEPAKAKVKIARKKGRIHVEITDFISPTIVERLQQQAGVVAPKIDDWRAMVDCVMIDTAYDGTVFSVVLADIPEKKADFVDGAYDLAACDKGSTVAVKIIDMLGEEVLVTKNM